MSNLEHVPESGMWAVLVGWAGWVSLGAVRAITNSSQIKELKTHVRERFDLVEHRFDRIDEKLDALIQRKSE